MKTIIIWGLITILVVLAGYMLGIIESDYDKINNKFIETNCSEIEEFKAYCKNNDSGFFSGFSSQGQQECFDLVLKKKRLCK